MKNILTTLILTVICIASYSQKMVFDSVVNSIQLQMMKNHVYTLAADSMGGRNTSEPGQKMAAKYIASHYQKGNVPSISDSVPYYQFFSLYQYDLGDSEIRFSSKSPHDNNFYRISSRFYSNSSKKTQDTVACVFIGHGTSNDIKGVDYKNKAIAMLCENLSSGIEAYRNLPDFKSIAYVNLIFKKGIGEYRMGKYHINNANNYYKIYSAFNFLTLETFNKEYLHERQEVIHSLDSLFGNDHDYSAFFVGNRFCELAYNKTWKDLNNLSLKNEKTENNLLLDIPAITALAEVNFTKSKLIEYPTENILGYIPGTDLKNEVIVVTAHYDHVGTDKIESTEAIYAENDTICYGADDNATGTAAVIEMAKAFMKAKEAGYENRRSIIFAALSAEEKGLRGAFHYVNNAPFALDSTVLNVNLDMIGRDSKNKEKYSNSVFILSLGQKKGLLKSTPKKENKKLNRQLKVDGTPGLKERLTWKFSSDHYHFKKQGIPALIFFTGLHPDYHTPADTPDKINYDKLTRITRLSFLSVWNLANSDEITVPDRSKLKTKENLIDKVMK